MHANMEIHKEIVKMNFKRTLGIHHSDITFTVSYFFFLFPCLQVTPVLTLAPNEVCKLQHWINKSKISSGFCI